MSRRRRNEQAAAGSGRQVPPTSNGQTGVAPPASDRQAGWRKLTSWRMLWAESKKVLPVLVCFLVAEACAFSYLWSEQVGVMSGLDVSLERVITEEGTVLDLRDTGDNLIWLREMDAQGRVKGQVALSKTGEVREGFSEKEFLMYRIMGFLGDEVLLYEYGHSPNVPERVGKQVIACSLATGSVRTVGAITDKEAVAGGKGSALVFCSFGVVRNGLYFGYVSGTHSDSVSLSIRRMDLSSGLLSEEQTIEADFDLAWFNVAPDGTITAVSLASDVYRYRAGNWELLHASIGEEALASASAGKNGTLFFFMVTNRDGRLYALEPNDKTLGRTDAEGVGAALSVTCWSSDTFVTKECAGESSSEEFCYGVSVAGNRGQIRSLSVPFHLLWTQLALFRFGGILAALGLLFLLAAHIWLRRYTGIAIKQILAAVPIFGLGLFLLLGFSRDLISDLTYADRYLALSEKGAAAVAEIDGRSFAHINWNAPTNDPYFMELQKQVDERSAYSEMSWWDSGGTDLAWWDDEILQTGENRLTRRYYTSHWILRVEGDGVYTALCSASPANLEIAYINKRQRNAAFNELIAEEALPVRTMVYDSGGEGYWIAVFLPILDGTKLVGILEVSEPALGLDTRIRTINTMTLIIAGAIMLAALLAIIFVLHFTLRALRRLKAGAQAVSAGDYSVRVDMRSHDEPGDIGAAFNIMAKSVEEAIADITATSEGYSRFVPARLIEALGKSSIKELEQGANTELEATHMFLSTDSFDGYRKENFFKMLNLFYGVVIGQVSSAEGIIEHFSGNGFSALYRGGVEPVLNAIIAMYRDLERVNAQLVAGGARPIECHVMLNRSETLLGVAGTDRRLSIISVSTLGYKTERIAALGRLCASRLILAQSAFSALGEAAQEHPHRWIGYIRVGKARYRLYDFYFCEPPELRRLKGETKEAFEKGVHLYYEGNYRDASSTFVRVVKASPNDALAREYLLRCHNLGMKEQEPTELMEL
jgi:HAMP domain-containing protein